MKLWEPTIIWKTKKYNDSIRKTNEFSYHEMGVQSSKYFELVDANNDGVI